MKRPQQKRYSSMACLLATLYLAILALPSTVSAQTLTIDAQPTGLVTSAVTVPSLLGTLDIACGTDNRYGSSLAAASTTYSRCRHTYQSGAQVTLTASPNHPHRFIGWLGDCRGTSSQLTLTMNRNMNCRAIFAKPDGYVQADTSVGQQPRFKPQHTCAVTSAGFVHCWGNGANGQIGDGAFEIRNAPTTATGIANAIAVAVGGAHTCALLANGAAQCWGRGVVGQLGDGTTGGSRATPAAVSGLTNAIAIAAGQQHNCVVLADRTMQCWGADSSGQLGNGIVVDPTTNASRPDRPIPVAVSDITNAVAVAAGRVHSCAVLANGSVQCWGAGVALGDGTRVGKFIPTDVINVSNAVAITTRRDHTCAVLANGNVQCWGLQTSGRLGDDNDESLSVLISPDRYVLTPTATVMGISTAVTAAAGQSHTCVVLRDGQAQCWGALTPNKNSNDSGTGARARLGNGRGGGSLTPVDVVNIRAVVDIAAGRHTSCAVLRNGLAYCWGSDVDGAIGDGDVTASSYTSPQLVAGQSMTPNSLRGFVLTNNDFTQQIKRANPASTWSISPPLSAGLRFDTGTGTVYGRPTASAAGRTYTITGTGTGTASSIVLTLTVAALTDFSIRQTGEDLRITENSPLGTEVNGLNLQLLYLSNPVAVDDIRWSLVSVNPPNAGNPFLVAPDGAVYVGGNTDSRALDYERLADTDRQFTLSARAGFAGVVGFPVRLPPDSNIRISVINVIENIRIRNVLHNAIPRIRSNAEVNEPVGGISLVGREGFPGTPLLNGLTWDLNPASAFTISSRTGTVRVANSLSSLSVGSSATVVVSASKDGVTSNNLSLTIGITPSAELLKLHIKTFLEGPLQ